MAAHDNVKARTTLPNGTGASGDIMMDPRYGGQNGYMINLGTGGKQEWMNNSAFVSGNVIAVVLETPPFLKFFDNKDILQEYLIALVETHTEEINGLNAGVTLETAKHNISGAGQEQAEVVDSKRAQSDISHKYIEKPGKVINRLLDFYLRYGIMDPDTKRPLVTTTAKFRSEATEDEKLYTPDMWSMTILYMELDFGMMNVTEAFAVTNHYPTTDGGVEVTKNLANAKAIKEVDIKWEGIVESGPQTRVMAQRIFDAMSITKTRPEDVPLFINDRSASVRRPGIRNYNTPIKD